MATGVMSLGGAVGPALLWSVTNHILGIGIISMSSIREAGGQLIYGPKRRLLRQPAPMTARIVVSTAWGR